MLRFSWLSQNSYLRWMQLALPKPSGSPSTHGAGPFPSTPRTECVSDGHWSPCGHWQGFPWGYIIVLVFYLCRNRNSHVCTVNCSVSPMGQDSHSTELKRKLPSMLSWGGRQHIPNMDGWGSGCCECFSIWAKVSTTLCLNFLVPKETHDAVLDLVR